MGILFFILLPQDPCYSKWLELAVLVSPEAWDRNSGTGQTYWICIVTRSPGYIKDGEALPECLNISHSSHQKTPVRIEPLFPNLKAEIKLSNIFKVKQPVKDFWLQVYSKEKKNHITSLGSSKRESDGCGMEWKLLRKRVLPETAMAQLHPEKGPGMP